MSRRKSKAADTATEGKATESKRDYTQGGVTVEHPNIRCVRCGTMGYGSGPTTENGIHRLTNTWKNGNRRRICFACGKPFTSRREKK